MRQTLAALSFAAGIGLICCQSAGAMPAGASALQEAATAASTVQQAQYREYRGRHHITKCYREFVVGTYACHRYRTW